MIQTLADALAAQGYDTLTPVQEAVTAPELQSADLLVSAQTGSGKTVGFGLAIAPTLLDDDTHFGPAAAPLALVIAPTRELALQVARELTWLYGPAGATVTTCVGGMDQRTERRALDRGAHIVVATPGRLCDHIKRGNVDLSDIRAVVLDEADEMLDLGFREELEYILSEAPETRRTLLFSATVPPAIAKMAKAFQKDAQRVETVGEARQHADISYRALDVHARDSESAIINVLRFYEARNAIVFCNTRAAVARLTTKFTNRGFSVVALSGELTQSERSNALQALRDGRARVCVATDVAARGIDLPNLELVIHADLPSNAETLLHRSGRTGRAGRKGVSALIVPPKMRGKAKRLLGWAKLNAEWSPAPSAEAVREADEQRLLSDPVWEEPIPETAQGLAAQLAERFSAEVLAGAFVNLFRARASAPEELLDPQTRDDVKDKAPFGASVWFSISMGGDDGAEPRRLLPMLCRKGDLDRTEIGAIRVTPKQSYAEVREEAVDKLIAALGGDMTLEDGVQLTRLATAPDLPRPGPRGPRPGGPKPGGYKSDRGPRPDRGDRPDRGPRPDRSDRPDRGPRPERPARKERDEEVHRSPRAAKPTGDKPKARAVWKKDSAEAPRKPKPAGKPYHPDDERPRKPRGDKPFGKPGGKPAGKSFGKPGGKGPGKPAGKPGAKPSAGDSAPGGRNYQRAADPSKPFTPPSQRGKPGGRAPRTRGAGAPGKGGKKG